MKALIISTLAASSIFLAGCATGEGARTPVVKTKAAIEDSSRYALMGPRVQRSIDFSSTQEKYLEDGRLEVITNVRNRENRRIEVQISCVFKDERNFSTGDETPWRSLILTENAQEAVNFTSMNNRAKNFTIRVREAH
jgi:predicted small secreted protein